MPMPGQLVLPWSPTQHEVDYNVNTATSATTLTAKTYLTGGHTDVVLAMTGTLAAGATATTDTAANIYAALPQNAQYIGYSYKLRIINESSGAFSWTIAAGTGVTISGTLATIAQNTWREWIVTLTGVDDTPAVTMQSCGVGTYS